MMLDYHIHTWRCRHAEGEMKDYLDSAVKKGVSEIGFSDHFPYLAEHKKSLTRSIPLDRIAMPEKELPLYVKDVLRLRTKSKIPVKLGCEIDFFPGSVAAFNILREYDFDYFIGSVHFIDGWGFDQDQFKDRMTELGAAKVYRRYLALIASMAETRLFDIVGHFDLPKKFGVRPPAGLEGDFRRAIEAARRNGMALELNTSGLDRAVGEVYPSEKILGMCFDLGIPVTLGSDSHKPGEVGRHFGEARKLLKRIGYKNLASFDRHVLRPVPL